MPQNIIDVIAFTDPVTAPADGDALTGAEIVAHPIQALANRTRYLKEMLEPSPLPSRSFVVAASALSQLNNGFTIDGFGDTARAVQASANARLIFDLRNRLPTGAIVTTVEAMVTPSAARSLGFRMNLSAYYKTPDWSTPADPVQAGPLVEDDGTATIQVLSVSPGRTIATGELLTVEVSAGNGAPNTDIVHALRVTFQDPGPRSY